MDSSAFISNTLDPDDGWMEMKPEYHQMLTRFHPLNETSQVVEKINSSAATGKVANIMSPCLPVAWRKEEVAPSSPSVEWGVEEEEEKLFRKMTHSFILRWKNILGVTIFSPAC